MMRTARKIGTAVEVFVPQRTRTLPPAVQRLVVTLAGGPTMVAWMEGLEVEYEADGLGEMNKRHYALAGMPYGDSAAGRLVWLSRMGLRGRIAEPGWVWNESDTRRIWALNQLELIVRRASR
jgi:hypothetical protein